MPEDFVIDPEFVAILPPLLEGERERLCLSLQRSRYVEPGVVGLIGGSRRILLDGHNRRELCGELSLPFPTRTIELPDREAVMAWIIDNQLGRRNLTDERRAYYLGKQYANEKGGVGGQLPKGVGQFVPPLEDQRASAAIAERHGVNEKTVRRAEKFAEAVDAIAATDPTKAQEILAGVSGMSRQEVIEAAVLCERCKRVGAVQDCQQCEWARMERRRVPERVQEDKEAVAARETAQVKDAERAVFDWQAFEADFGLITMAPQRMLAAHPDMKNTPLWNDLSRLITNLSGLVKEARKKFAPKEE